MQIKLIFTNDLNSSLWESYVIAFNMVFNRGFNASYFRQKYLNTIDGFSRHALLLSEDGEILGSITAIPYLYTFSSQTVRGSLIVDVFIVEKARKDPMTLRILYSLLKKQLKEDNIKIIFAIPNDAAYTYWKKIVRWKEVGEIPYYAMPIKIGNIVGKSFLKKRILVELMLKG
jgi:hypothetical protein